MIKKCYGLRQIRALVVRCGFCLCTVSVLQSPKMCPVVSVYMFTACLCFKSKENTIKHYRNCHKFTSLPSLKSWIFQSSPLHRKRHSDNDFCLVGTVAVELRAGQLMSACERSRVRWNEMRPAANAELLTACVSRKYPPPPPPPQKKKKKNTIW